MIMQIKPECDDLSLYLATSQVIDFGYDVSREVTELSYEITTYSKNEVDYVKNAYEYVRDKIAHSADGNGQVVTCKASEVLRAGEGCCFAKSHFLAAILRCNLIPTGFCYQRLILDDANEPYLVLHGLVGVYLEDYDKWIRLDPRGNKAGIDSQFSLGEEKLAYPVRSERGEEDIPIIFHSPDSNVLEALTKQTTLDLLWGNLPTALSVANRRLVSEATKA